MTNGLLLEFIWNPLLTVLYLVFEIQTGQDNTAFLEVNHSKAEEKASIGRSDCSFFFAPLVNQQFKKNF
jgi:hypothetical protein